MYVFCVIGCRWCVSNAFIDGGAMGWYCDNR